MTHGIKERNELIRTLKEKENQIEFQKAELTERQTELEESLDRYADLYDFAPSAYLTLDEKGRIIEINQTGAELLTVDKKGSYEIPFIYFLSHNDVTKFFTAQQKVRHSNSRTTEEFSLKVKNNEPVYVHAVITPVHNYVSKNINYRLSLVDITEKKEIERALIESEQRFRIMAESAPVMIWMSDTNNNLLYANSSKLRFLGKSFNEIKDQGWLSLIHPHDKDKFFKIFSKALEEWKKFSIEMRIKDRNNEYSWIIREGVPYLLPDGKTSRLIGSEIDITDRKKTAILMEKSLREKEVLLKEIHHRVKNNLQIISSLLNLQLNFVINKEVSEVLKSSQARIRSMALIHEKIYKSSEFSTINFSEYVKELVSFLFKTYRRKSANIRLDMNLADINLDINISVSLGLIINELITNSLKHAFPDERKGEIKIFLSEKNNDLELIVSDNGVGVPNGLDIKKTNSLGLELVDTLIEQHNGELKFECNGKTEFKILLHKNQPKNRK